MSEAWVCAAMLVVTAAALALYAAVLGVWT